VLYNMYQFNLFTNPFRNLGNYGLVIIDMQPHFLSGLHKDKKDQKQVAEVCFWQQQLIDEYGRTQGNPVIFVEYDNGFGKFGSKVLRVEERDHRIRKNIDDATLANLYTNIVDLKKPNDLMEVLKLLNTQTAVVLGCNAAACVLDSISSLRKNEVEVYTSRQGLLSQSTDPQRLEYALREYDQLGVHVQ